MALSNVVALVWDGVGTFGLGVAAEVFGVDRSDGGLPVYDFAVAAERPGRVPTEQGFPLVVEHGLERVAEADLVIALGWNHLDREPSEAVRQALRDAVARGARVMSHCTGAFVLGAAGLLDGRRCTTHWMYADLLARRYPTADVDPDVLYVLDGPVLSSAGTAASIDASLHLLRLEHGAAVANEVARRMVVPPHRDGGQAQYVQAPVPRCAGDDPIAEVSSWMVANLHTELTVEDLARRAAMSPRTFARRFRAATGTTPHQWLLRQRVLHAQRLLETTDDPVERIASSCGFGSAAVLRQHFGRVVGTSPLAYRRTFQQVRA
jgi:transcriptional regulator GlxA family with amidase domain